MTTIDHICRAIIQINATAATPRRHIQERVAAIVGCHVSARTLQRALSQLQYTRRQVYQPTDAEILQVMEAHRHDTAELVGAVLMLSVLPEMHPDWRVPRERMRQLLHVLNPEAVAFRQAIHVHPRIYRSRGPDDTWHLDQHDKLKPYGFPLHGCIDGYSRKILWLVVVPSNDSDTY